LVDDSLFETVLVNEHHVFFHMLPVVIAIPNRYYSSGILSFFSGIRRFFRIFYVLFKHWCI